MILVWTKPRAFWAWCV